MVKADNLSLKNAGKSLLTVGIAGRVQKDFISRFQVYSLLLAKSCAFSLCFTIINSSTFLYVCLKVISMVLPLQSSICFLPQMGYVSKVCPLSRCKCLYLVGNIKCTLLKCNYEIRYSVELDGLLKYHRDLYVLQWKYKTTVWVTEGFALC